MALFLLSITAYAVSAADLMADENNSTDDTDGNATDDTDGNATDGTDGNATDGNTTDETDGNATDETDGNATDGTDGNATDETDGNATDGTDGNATDGNVTELQNIIDTAIANNFTTFVTAVEATELNFTFKEAGPFTVFAPTDDAFAALPAGTLDAWLNDTEALEKVLFYHFTVQKLNESDIINMTNITTMEGSNLSVNVTDGVIMVDNATIIMSDIQAMNGVIHSIDAVMLPPGDGNETDGNETDGNVTELQNIIDTAIANNFTTFVTAVEATELNFTFKEAGTFTVFAPTDDAFAALPAGTLDAWLNDTTALEKVLYYHVADQKLNESDIMNMTNVTTLEGSNLSVNVTDGVIMVDNATIIISDIQASNGVIHSIDAVMLPPGDDNETDGNETDGNVTELQNIIDTAIANNFTTFITAVEATELNFTFKEAGTFTVFAPTDDAFAALPAGTLDAWLNDTAALEKVLYYHVADQKLNESDIMNMTNVTTLEGSNLSVNVTDGVIMVDNATIIISDIQASNGVIHAIDTVMLPPGDDNETDGNETDGNETDGNETDGNETDGNETDGNETDGNVTELQNIIDTAIANNFTTFVTVVEATELNNTLKGEGPFTVFVPTDDVLDAFPEGTLAALLNDTVALEKVLSYHVADQKLNKSDIMNMTNITTLEGSDLTVNVTAEGVMINDAMITMSDIQASNGVIHAIDAVLLPPEEVKPGVWHFFSMPQKAMNPAADYLLAGVDYDSLIYYNSTDGLYENVIEIEPLKGYWIRTPAGSDFNTTEIFASIEEEMPVTPTSLYLYPGWNAVGSPVLSALSAEAAFTSMDAYYAKVVGPWVPNESGSGSYSYVGYNGQSGMLNGNQVGTDNFTVDPYEGYWVYVLEETTLA